MAATVYIFDGQNFSATGQDLASFVAETAPVGRNCKLWIDLVDVTESELRTLKDAIEIPESVLTDFSSDKINPRFVPFQDGAMYLLLHRVFYHFDSDVTEFRPLGFYVADSHLVTFRTRNVSRLFERTREKVACNPSVLFEGGGLPIMIIILEGLFSDYYPMLEKSSDELDALEAEVFRTAEDDLQKKVIRELLKFKKLASAYRKAFIAQRALLLELAESVRTLSRRVKRQHHDPNEDQADFSALVKALLDDWAALASEVDSLSGHSGAVFEVYSTSLMIEMARSSSKQNSIMQRLNIMTAIFLPLTFIVGVYGMNIPNMPELTISNFYFVLLSAMALLVVVMLLIFKRMKWM